MLLQKSSRPLGIILLVVAMLAATMATVAAAPQQQNEEQSGIFGEVVAVEGNVLQVETKEGVVSLQVTEDTQFREQEELLDSLDAITPGDRIGALVVSQDDLLIAQTVMVIPQQVSVVHLIGIVMAESEGAQSLLTEDGRQIPVEFGLNRSIPEPGTVVTIVGHLDSDTGVVRVRSIQRLEQTLQRLSDHLDEIQEAVPDKESQAHHLGRVQRALKKTSERQLEILNEAVDYLPEEARPAMEKALQNLEEANKAVAQAFNQALELAGEEETDEGHPEGPEGYELPEEIEPSLEDVAEVLGLSEDALIELLVQGLTLTQIAEDVGFTEEALMEGVLARVRERLEQLVEEGQLDPEAVDLIIDQMSEEADYHLDRVFTDEELAPAGIPFSMEDLAAILGMEPSELFARLHKGDNLLQIAQEQGFSRDQLLEAIMELARQRAQRLVDQGAIWPMDVERFLRHFLKEVEEKIGEVSPRSDGPDEEPPITPEDVADILGITIEELFAHFEGGGTLQELALRHEMTVEELVGKILHKARQRLAHLVDEGKLSPTEARGILDRLREELLQEIDDSGKSPISPPETPPGEPVDIPFDFSALARALDLSPRDLHDLLSEGYTLEELAEEQGISLNDLVDILISPMEDKLRQMVEEGRIVEDQARDMLAKMMKHLLKALEEFQLPRAGEPHPDDDRFRPDPSFRPYPEIPLTLGDAARVLGIPFEEMMERMDETEDIRELQAERGLTIEQFIAALYDVVRGRLEERVSRGELSEEEAGHILAELKHRLFQDLAGVGPVSPTPIPPEPFSEDIFARPTDIPFNLGQIAHVLGFSPDELRRLLSQGYSLAEVADKLDASLEDLVDPLIAPLKAKIIELVETGHLSERLAREVLEQARDELEHELEQAWRAVEEEHRVAWEDLEEEHRAAWEDMDKEYQEVTDALDEAQERAWHALDEEHQDARDALDEENQRAWEELDEAHQQAWEAIQTEHDKAWQALDEQYQAARNTLDEEYQIERNALDEAQLAARDALGKQYHSARLALDEEQEAAWQALEEECQAALAALAEDDTEGRAEAEKKCQVVREELVEQHIAARQVLEEEQLTGWQALDRKQEAAWQTLDSEKEAAWHTLDDEYQVTWEALQEAQEEARDALERDQREAWHALDEENRAAWEALDREQHAARDALDEGMREAWGALDRRHEEDWRALDLTQLVIRYELDETQLAGRRALEDTHREAFEDLEGEEREAWQALYEEQQAARYALEEAQQAIRHAVDQAQLEGRHALADVHQRAWEALDQEHRKAWEALEQEHRPARLALDKEHQGARQVLDEAQRAAWDALEKECKSAFDALSADDEHARREMEQNCQAARGMLEEDHQRAWDALQLAQQEAWRALDEEHQRAFQAMDGVQEAARHGRETELRGAWEALDRQHEEAWRALDEEHQRAWEALEEEHEAAWRALEEALANEQNEQVRQFIEDSIKALRGN